MSNAREIDLPRFVVAAIVAGFVVLLADRFGWFFIVGSRLGAHFAIEAFAWACMFGAVVLVSPAPRHWANALVCGLLLAVAFFLAWEVSGAIFLGVINNLYVSWIANLTFFALALWPIWRWYVSPTRASSRNPGREAS